MKGRITVNWLAREINKYCRNYKYFWACGLVRESMAVWKNPRAYAYLNEQARIMADHYLEETKQIDDDTLGRLQDAIAKAGGII